MSTPRSDARRPTVAVVTPDPELVAYDPGARAQTARGSALAQGLAQAGYELVALLPAGADLEARIAELRPDLLIVEAESGVRDLLEHIVFVTRDTPRPIVLFTDDDDVETARMAVAAGVTAYIVDGLRPGRVRPVIEVALARFAREQGLRAQLDDARRQLVERKTVERAKGLLMKRLRVDEDEAFARLRRLAMEKGLKLAEIAQRLLDAAELL
jgi:two-component system, response regulator / RNA-binding antiterminator